MKLKVTEFFIEGVKVCIIQYKNKWYEKYQYIMDETNNCPFLFFDDIKKELNIK